MHIDNMQRRLALGADVDFQAGGVDDANPLCAAVGCLGRGCELKPFGCL